MFTFFPTHLHISSSMTKKVCVILIHQEPESDFQYINLLSINNIKNSITSPYHRIKKKKKIRNSLLSISYEISWAKGERGKLPMHPLHKAGRPQGYVHGPTYFSPLLWNEQRFNATLWPFPPKCHHIHRKRLEIQTSFYLLKKKKVNRSHRSLHDLVSRCLLLKIHMWNFF